jgi:hypothetical protein
VAEPGIGPIVAAQLWVSWSHPGRIRSEAAFAALTGASPLPASSGQVTRFRLNRGGDRHLNRALHQVMITRLSCHAPTREYVLRRISNGKSQREAQRCIKRYLARFRRADRLRATTSLPRGLTSPARRLHETQGTPRPNAKASLTDFEVLH